MPNFICVTCGTQFAANNEEPAGCPICEDERQYVGWNGQQWTTLEQLRRDHHNVLATEEDNLTSIVTEPGFAIGQRALLVQTPKGNVLWDCISLIDDATVAAVNQLGGVKAIAISHPHFYSSMVEWSRVFNDAPVLVHADDVSNLMRPDRSLLLWRGEQREIVEGVTLVRCGGHFSGSSVLHWAAGAKGRGALLSGDTIQVVSDRRYVSFMRSYPNLIPLSAREVRRILSAVEPFAFDRIYGAWTGRIVQSNARSVLVRSAERYIHATSS
ncbi:MAG: MBL fold metallo-hydrolase [Chloroflexi bacterium]|nr:MBL fold metallo-hydrolase [Chloroflexota bacterium]MCL5274551.1 MBL fold metallo-hydrolase [Chloroflexota bacterium]